MVNDPSVNVFPNIMCERSTFSCHAARANPRCLGVAARLAGPERGRAASAASGQTLNYPNGCQVGRQQPAEADIKGAANLGHL